MTRIRVTTWNVNGIRAASRKGLLAKLDELQTDVLLLQEVRALPEQIPAELLALNDWQMIWNPAQKLGYSGTAVWTRTGVTRTQRGFSDADLDLEGRILSIQLRDIKIACIYLPSGSAGPHRQKSKDQFLRRFTSWAAELRESGPTILAGDLNVAPTEADIFYAKANEGTSGFLPHERRWFARLLKSGWHDVVRDHFGTIQGPYTWWSNRGRARELDRGWRIDHILCNPTARPLVRAAIVHRDLSLEISDHAPVSIDIEI